MSKLYKIRPLQWSFNGFVHDAEQGGVSLVIDLTDDWSDRHRQGNRFDVFEEIPGDRLLIGSTKTIGEAKEIAEAHYLKTIITALEEFRA